MLKTFWLASVLLALAAVAGCASTGAPQAAAPRGTPIGDTGIRVSGSVQVGGAATAR